jgi:hypothetical protein
MISPSPTVSTTNPDIASIGYNSYNMVSWADQQLALLRPKYPDWDIWAVRTVVPSGYVRCARPVGHPVATINADSPENLIKAIREQEAGAVDMTYRLRLRRASVHPGRGCATMGLGNPVSRWVKSLPGCQPLGPPASTPRCRGSCI